MLNYVRSEKKEDTGKGGLYAYVILIFLEEEEEEKRRRGRWGMGRMDDQIILKNRKEGAPCCTFIQLLYFSTPYSVTFLLEVTACTLFTCNIFCSPPPSNALYRLSLLLSFKILTEG